MKEEYARSCSALLADNDAANSGVEGERESGARTAHVVHGVGLDGTRKDASSGRYRSPTGKSPRKSLQRRPLGSSSILGAHRGEQQGLLDRAEQYYLSKEFLLEQKLKGLERNNPRQGKGDQKGLKGRGGKGDREKGASVGKGKDKVDTTAK